MSVPAEHPRTPVWTEEDWDRAFAARPDLVERLRRGDADALLDLLSLHPAVDARWVPDPS